MKHVLPWLAGWLALFWLWMLLAGDWSHTELIAAAAAATLAATIGEVARSRSAVRARISPAWVLFTLAKIVLIVFVGPGSGDDQRQLGMSNG